MGDDLRCRLCSKTEATTNLIDVLDDEDIHSKINSYLCLDVKNCDGSPTSICILCYGKLDNFHNFVVSIRKVQDDLAYTTKNNETNSNIDLGNGGEHEITYQDFESDTKYNPHRDTQTDIEIPIRKYRKRRSVLAAKPTRKSSRFKLTSKLEAAKKDAGVQAGSTLATDLENLKKYTSFQLKNLQGLEILALLPARLKLGCSVSQDSTTSKSCLAKLDLGVKTRSGEILMAPNSDSNNSKQLIKLPPPRRSK